MRAVERLIQLYRRNLSKYLFARYARDYIHRLVRLVYKLIHCRSSERRVYSIVRGLSLDVVTGAGAREIFPRTTMQLRGPVLLNGPRFSLPHRQLPVMIDVPAIQLWEAQDVAYLGGSSFTFAGEKVYIPAQADLGRDGFLAEVHGTVDLDRISLRMEICPRTEGREVEAGISLIGQNASNYAHWMTEILPKVSVLESLNSTGDLPLLVDADLPENMYESLRCLVGDDRKWVFVERWEFVKVRQAITISQPAYEPYLQDGIHERKISSHINTFSQEVFRKFNDILQKVHIDGGALLPKRLYLSRGDYSRNLRRVVNAEEIDVCLAGRRFDIVDTAELSFAAQVACCRSAVLIVAPVGAALSNMILAPRGCTIIALAPYYQEANFYYYSNLAESLGHNFYYLLGKQTITSHHPMHKDYEIDVDELNHTIDNFENGVLATDDFPDERADAP